MRPSAPESDWTAPSDPTWRWLLAGATLAAIAPLWIGRHLPFTDLPEHVATIATLRHWFDPAFASQEYFELVGPARLQYALYYFVGALLAVPLGAERANLVLLSLVVAGVPYGMRAILRAIRHDERLALYGVPLAWNFVFTTGFFNYTAALSIMLFGIATVFRHARTPTRRGSLTLAAYGIVLFYLHVTVLAFFALAAVVIHVGFAPTTRPTRPESRTPSGEAPASESDAATPAFDAALADTDAPTPRQPLASLATLPRRLVWLFPALALTASWIAFGGVVRSGYDETTYRTLSESLHALPEALLDVWRSSADEQVALALVAATIAIAWPQRRATEAPSLTRARALLLGLALVAIVLYFVLPHGRGVGAFIGHRYAIVAAMLLPLTLRPTPGWRGAAPLAVVGAIGVASAAVAVKEVRAFDRELGNFDALLAKTQPGRRLLTLVFDGESRTARFAPYVHIGSYYRARYGGIASMSFVELPQSPIAYRRDAAPPIEPHGWEWRPCVFRNAREGVYYDYVLTRGSVDPFAREPPGPVWKLLAEDGSFRLYEKVTGASIPPGDPDLGPCESPSIVEPESDLPR